MCTRGGRGGYGVCTRGDVECVPEGVGRVWSVYQNKESWPRSIARMRDSL